MSETTTVAAGEIPSEPERARRTLSTAILVFRWAALGWMAVLALTGDEGLRRAELAWVAIGATGAWTAWLTVPSRRGRDLAPDEAATLRFDLGLACALVLVSGIVMPAESVTGGRPFFATAYPAAAVLAWGAARGVGAGVGAAGALGIALVLSRPLNSVSLGELSRGEWQAIASGAVTFALAGGSAGIVSRLLARSQAQFRDLIGETLAARERAARLAERDRIGRTIHDSVLQSLALITKRGSELGARLQVPGDEVRRLAAMAAEQGRELRALILRDPDDGPVGTASLREALEAVAREPRDVPAGVSVVGAIRIEARAAGEIAAAVRQALENVSRHAGATRADVFAQEEEGAIVISIRDDGAGFEYDEQALRDAGKAGILQSMKGRIEDLGGTMRIDSAPGRGTEVEFTVPVPATAAREQGP